MNLYGKVSAPQHQLFGRIAPLCEALHCAMYRAAGKHVEPTALSKELPGWCHSIADRLGITIFKGIVGLAPKGKFDARNYGQMVGFMLRAITHFCKEVPAELKREGLLDLDPEREKKIEAMLDMPAILSFVSEKLKRPIPNEAALAEVGAAELEKRMETQWDTLIAIGRYLFERPVAEQHEFLCGIPEGFRLHLDNDGNYSGKRSRTELYLLLLMFWPEIAEMQKAEPPKTCRFLLDWLEKQEGKQFFEDEKQFYGLCGEIGLVMARPGHPRKEPPA